MSYRTYINGRQIFGNNEMPDRWLAYLKEKGVVLDEEYAYACDMTDFMELLQVMENIVLDYEKERKERIKTVIENNPGYENLDADVRREINVKLGLRSIFDFSDLPEKTKEPMGEPLFDQIMELVETGYALLPYTFFRICRDDLEEDLHFAVPGRFYCYKLKPGRTIRITAS